MPTSRWIELALAFHEKLNEVFPELISEVNALPVGIAYPIVLPVPDAAGDSIELDIDPSLIDGALKDFPRIQCGVFTRTVLDELTGAIEEAGFPYTIEIYIGAKTKKDVFVQAVKWGILLDIFFERYCDTIHPSFRCKPYADVDVTFSLPKGSGNNKYYSKLIACNGQFTSYE